MNDPESLLHAAETVAGILKRHRIDAVVIGAVALAAYHYVRQTVIDDALKDSKLVVRAGSILRLVPISQLIALKLYAGGYKAKADIVELLARNPDLDLSALRSTCERYRLSGIEELIAEASRSTP